MDIIRRGAKLVDKLIIGVTTNPSKSPMFADEERLAMVRREVAGISGEIEVVGFNALLMKFAQDQGASVIVRGLRAVADFEYEYQMAGMNQQLNADIETVFLMADVALQPIASKLVKEIAIYGGDIRKFVTAAVAGKATGKDAAAGKETFVSLLGLERAREQAHMLVEQAQSHLAGYGEKADLLRAIAQFIVARDH
jgi:pantetheine-phosphate adenylyltransferase